MIFVTGCCAIALRIEEYEGERVECRCGRAWVVAGADAIGVRMRPVDPVGVALSESEQS